MDEQTLRYYEQHAEAVADRYEEAGEGVAQYFAVAFPGRKKVLDVGAGSGRDLARLVDRGWDASGIEPSGAMRQTAIERHPELESRLVAGRLPDSVSSTRGWKAGYDGVLCSGVLHHVPRSRLFDAVFAIKELLSNRTGRSRGRALVSVPAQTERSDGPFRDREGRFHNGVAIGELELLFERTGFQSIGQWEDADSLGRSDRCWHTILLELTSTLGRPLNLIQAVLTQDPKVTTYKLALIRALCDLALRRPRAVRWQRHAVRVPVRAVAERWVRYYWPLLSSKPFLPQGNGEWSEGRHRLAFADELKQLIRMYERRGGLTAFDNEQRYKQLPQKADATYRRVMQKMRQAIKGGPVHHAGRTLEEGQIFHAQGREIVVDAAMWRELTLMGHWIEEALLLRWAEMVVNRFSAANGPSRGTALDALCRGPERKPHAEEAQSIYTEVSPLHCVWTGRRLRKGHFDVDHLLPFALWENNDLWNLLPASREVNRKKKEDKLPHRDLLHHRRKAIVAYWGEAYKRHPHRFNVEATDQTGDSQWSMDTLFDAVVEAVEVTALQWGWQRWHPSPDWAPHEA